MTTYTLTLREAETQFRQLVNRIQTTHQPTVVMAEENAKPMVVVMEMAEFEQAQRDRQRLFHLQRIHLAQWLDRVEQDWPNEKIRQECIATWQQSIKPLWDVCPEGVRDLCASLRLSVNQLSLQSFSLEQVAALRAYLELLRDTDPSEAAIDTAYQTLTKSGLPPNLAFDEKLVQLYLDEL